MFRKFIHFIQYNNLTIFLILAIFLLGTGVFAQTETGQALIGEKQTKIQGTDNTLLLEADLDKLNMDFKIEKIEQDQSYYYVTYTYLDLIKDKNAWQYQVLEKVRKVSKKQREDLGIYLAKEFKQQYEDRTKELKTEQTKAKDNGKEKRTEVVTYSGLIGQTLNLTSKVFSNYEPVKKTELPTPTIPPTILIIKEDGANATSADNLTDIYNDYITTNDPDGDNIFGQLDNCPTVSNPNQIDSNNNGVGDACDNDPIAPPAAATSTSQTENKKESEPIFSPESDKATGSQPVVEPDVEIVEPNNLPTDGETSGQ
jgi:hypothetical protein